MRLPCATLGLALALLLSRVAGDGLDVSVRIFRDQNCFEGVDELVLLDEGCYANLYSNLSKAYTVKAVSFSRVVRYHLSEYTDDCTTLANAKRVLSAGTCERFLGGYWALLTSRSRANTCQGDRCSWLAVAVQRFYTETNCSGLAYAAFDYPVQGECLRWSNGTQNFRVNSGDSTITQVDYLSNDRCRGTSTRTYTMTSGICYELYSTKAPKSFSWSVLRPQRQSWGSSSSSRPSKPAVVAPAIAALALLALLPAPNPACETAWL